MLAGVMLLWFVLTAAAVLFVALDIRRTPESPVLKWAFVLITLYTGPVGAFLYVLGCREPLPGLHERYVAIRWRQVLGSTMHCVAGDGVGIVAAAAIGGLVGMPPWLDITAEYVLGFGFGWTVFQAWFMRDSVGGSYRRALAETFLPELVSMNLLMAGMLPVMAAGMAAIPGGASPLTPAFWFVMSMALLVGFAAAFPVNWRLVARGLKHGMMTVRPPGIRRRAAAGAGWRRWRRSPARGSEPRGGRSPFSDRDRLRHGRIVAAAGHRRGGSPPAPLSGTSPERPGSCPSAGARRVPNLRGTGEVVVPAHEVAEGIVHRFGAPVSTRTRRWSLRGSWPFQERRKRV